MNDSHVEIPWCVETVYGTRRIGATSQGQFHNKQNDVVDIQLQPYHHKFYDGHVRSPCKPAFRRKAHTAKNW